jgi:hypothetical protein
VEVDGDVPGRRLGEVDQLVRQWAEQGIVKHEVAARFLALSEWQRRRRIQTWLTTGAPRRRGDELGGLETAAG